MGIIFSDKYEFPEKKFYYASSKDFIFYKFPELNDQHRKLYDSFSNMLTGDPNLVHVNVEPIRDENAEDGGEGNQLE